jgi:hypothetical protein
MGWRRRSLPTIDISPNDSDVEIVPQPKAAPAIRDKDGPSMAAFPLTTTTGERKFWSSTPDSRDPNAEVSPSSRPPPRRRRGRSFLAKLLFLAIFAVALTLLACEISISFKLPWLDPRPVLSTVKRLAVEKISHLRDR